MAVPKQKVFKIAWITVAVIFGLVLVIVLDTVVRLYLVGGKPLPAPTNTIITASPVNLSQIAGISKFRSCQGHDNSGKGANGVIEGNRSMKHYFSPLDDLREQLGKIEIFAPFDGEIVYHMGGGHGSEIMIAPEADKKWAIIVFHIDMKPGVGSGTRVKAGDLIGYANTKGRHDFDIAFTRTEGNLLVERLLQLFRGTPHFMIPKANYLVSPFDYMTEEVLQQFRATGFDPSAMQYSQEYRDENPCDFSKSGLSQDDWQYLPGQAPQTPQQQMQSAPQPDQSDQTQQAPQPVLYP